MFLKIILGYTACYFMKSFYALLNRAIKGIENDKLELDWVASLGVICFFFAAEFCLRRLNEESEKQFAPFKKILQLFLLVGTVAVVIEGIAGILEIRILFIACYFITIICIYVITVKTRVKVRSTKNVLGR